MYFFYIYLSIYLLFIYMCVGGGSGVPNYSFNCLLIITSMYMLFLES